MRKCNLDKKNNLDKKTALNFIIKKYLINLTCFLQVLTLFYIKVKCFLN
ncbi:hypothetical protein PRO82_001721 [Candidatus Protochlamydia amoebophila]|nr:hypothetical protein [Candidatus Protochlamydia amoebophila]